MRRPPAQLAAIYARYSSENQREESIVDQIASCRAWAEAHAVKVLEAHIYSDSAESGASHHRAGLLALKGAAEQGRFGVVIVDDLSRLARDNTYMLSLIADLDYAGVRVVSVAEHLDTADEEAVASARSTSPARRVPLCPRAPTRSRSRSRDDQLLDSQIRLVEDE